MINTMTKKFNSVYETPELELMEISSEGILCASVNYSTETYMGDDVFEKLF